MKNLIDTLGKVKKTVGNCEVSIETGLYNSYFISVRWYDRYHSTMAIPKDDDGTFIDRFIEQCSEGRKERDRKKVAEHKAGKNMAGRSYPEYRKGGYIERIKNTDG